MSFYTANLFLSTVQRYNFMGIIVLKTPFHNYFISRLIVYHQGIVITIKYIISHMGDIFKYKGSFFIKKHQKHKALKIKDFAKCN